MTRSRVIACVGIGALLFALAITLFHRMSREPEFGGQTLSAWIDLCRARTTVYPVALDTDPQRIIAVDAIRQIGTNGLPCLVKWLNYRPPKWRRKLAESYRKLPGRFKNATVEKWVSCPDPDLLRVRACTGFRELGPVAARALPELLLLVDNPRASGAAIRSMGFIGPPAAPYLQQLVNHPDGKIRYSILAALHGIPAEAAEYMKGGSPFQDWRHISEHLQ